MSSCVRVLTTGADGDEAPSPDKTEWVPTPNGGMVKTRSFEEFDVVKHALPWRGSLKRTIAIAPDEISTTDPATGAKTNSWPISSLLEWHATDGASGLGVTIRFAAQPLLCGMSRPQVCVAIPLMTSLLCAAIPPMTSLLCAAIPL